MSLQKESKIMILVPNSKGILINVIFLLIFSSCSVTKKKAITKKIKSNRVRYDLIDNSGNFQLVREVGLNKRKQLVVKSMILPSNGELKPLEKNITISTTGFLKIGPTKVSALQPKISQYTVWLGGKKFFSEISINSRAKSALVKMISPEKTWNGTKKIKIENTKGIFCFYSQLIECIRATHFVEKAIEKDSGKIKVNIIWNGYPYFYEQYAGIPNELITSANLIYEGKDRSKEYHFKLDFNGESIFYRLDKFKKLSKMFWISQGLSLKKTSIQ